MDIYREQQTVRWGLSTDEGDPAKSTPEEKESIFRPHTLVEHSGPYCCTCSINASKIVLPANQLATVLIGPLPICGAAWEADEWPASGLLAVYHAILSITSFLALQPEERRAELQDPAEVQRRNLTRILRKLSQEPVVSHTATQDFEASLRNTHTHMHTHTQAAGLIKLSKRQSTSVPPSYTNLWLVFRGL